MRSGAAKLHNNMQAWSLKPSALNGLKLQFNPKQILIWGKCIKKHLSNITSVLLDLNDGQSEDEQKYIKAFKAHDKQLKNLAKKLGSQWYLFCLFSHSPGYFYSCSWISISLPSLISHTLSRSLFWFICLSLSSYTHTHSLSLLSVPRFAAVDPMKDPDAMNELCAKIFDQAFLARSLYCSFYN